jgi:hypothetical protein
MIFSVHVRTNPVSERYQYYEVAGAPPPTAWFRKPAGRTLGAVHVGASSMPLFVAPETLAVRLPPGAKLVGVGPLAHGVVATRDQSLGSGSPAGDAKGGIGLFPVLAAFAVGWFFGRKDW